MSRTFLYLSCSFQYAFRACVFAVILAATIALSPSVFADPHAVFYTDRAQEQLFYNTLAALNQADFVEPTEGQFSRSVLLSRRETAAGRTPGAIGDSAFAGEQNPLIRSTRTELPTILSRSVTLEGDDLWTAYLVNQFAIETSTRRSTSELARIYCERGLGRAGCSKEVGKESQQQSKAFTNSPIDRESEVAFARDSILLSEDANENELRKQLEDTPQKERDDPLYVPRYNNRELSAFRKNIEGQEGPLAILSGLISNISGISSSGLDTETFKNTTYTDGELALADQIDGEDITLDQYTYKLSQLSSLPNALRTIANEGEADARASQYYEENQTAIADSTLVEKNGAIVREIQVPASAKIALINAGANLAVQVAQNQHFANPQQIGNPDGKTRAVPINSITATPTPSVAGISTTISSDTQQQAEIPPTPDGQVAGLTTALYNLYQRYYYNSPPKTNSPSDNLINPILESGPRDIIGALTNDTFHQGSPDPNESSCGFCIQMDSILESAKETVDNIFCTLFPTTEYCRTNQTNSIP